MCSNRVSKSGRGPSAGGAKVAAQPTCMCALGPSTVRNDASRADSRSGGMALSPQSGLRPRPCGGAIRPREAGYSRIRLRPTPLYEGLSARSDISREGVAGGRVAGVEALLEPARALLRGPVRERLRADPARRLGLDAIVTDGCRRGQALLEIALLEQPALVGGVRPHARQAVGLQFLAD